VNHGQLQRVLDGVAGDQAVGSHCRVRTHRGHVSVCYRYGASLRVVGMLTSRPCLALVRAASVADDRHSAPDAGGDLHDHRRGMRPPLRRTCTLEVSMSGAGPGGAGIPAKAWAAAHWNGRSDPGCQCGRGAVLFRGALGRHLKWVADGCWSVVRVRGGCARFATSLMGRWQAAAKAGRCHVGQ
jgi:hypothetical protein